MSVADDYGRFYAAPATVRGACWPTCPEKVSEKEVTGWLLECTSGERPLISVYETEGCKYLQIEAFGQQTRTKSKFPPQTDTNVISDCYQTVGTSRSRISETKAESEKASPSLDSPAANQERAFTPRELFDLWNERAPGLGLMRCLKLDNGIGPKIKTRLKEHPEREFWMLLMEAVSNSPALLGKQDSGWKVSLDWIVKNPQNTRRIAEGQYANRKLTPGQRTAQNLSGGEEVAEDILFDVRKGS